MERQLSMETQGGGSTSGLQKLKKLMLKDGETQENDGDCKKTQAQRLFEFELWTDNQTFRDLEYSQRRKEKKQRQRERKKARRKRRWKRLYLPALVCMVIGTFLTLCGTVRSMGGNSVLWQGRSVLVVMGPALLGLGFLGLMLAAACTFEHNQPGQEDDQELDPFAQYYLSEMASRETNNPPSSHSRARPAAALRSTSVDTADLPIPDDLDPSKNYLLAKPGWVARSGQEKDLSHGSLSNTVFLDVSNSYVSTASWVRSVSASHSPSHSLTRQNSDSNLLAAHSSQRYLPDKRSSLQVGYAEGREVAGSHSDLHVVCTRSWTSSGYQSASDSTSGTAECQLSSENQAGLGGVCSWASLRQQAATRRSAASTDTTAKALTIKAGLPRQGSSNTACHYGLQRTPVHDALRQYPAQALEGRGRERTTASCSARRRSDTLTLTPGRLCSLQGRESQSGFSTRGKETSSELNVNRKMSEAKTASFLYDPQDKHHTAHGKTVIRCATPRHPVSLEPVVYSLGSVRCTDL